AFYPNPMEKEATLSLAAPDWGNWEMTISSVLGQPVQKSFFTGKTATIRRENWPPGVYFYKVTGKDLNLNGKFVAR
ncbi:MAG TPA: T9SS type A sorting domain-containing protein, partial [Candidatus Paceibacterota bacterium]|nr:T9SS type A sorting domain-containing protein [Candidatus Paceibacterota bacterium]